jgi:hypothetical protein
LPLSDLGLMSVPLSFQSRAASEVHPDNFTAPAKFSMPRCVSGWSFVIAVGVGHAVSCAAEGRGGLPMPRQLPAAL